jgi:hypothetical protein
VREPHGWDDSTPPSSGVKSDDKFEKKAEAHLGDTAKQV